MSWWDPAWSFETNADQHSTSGAFTRVPQVDQRGWINEIEFNGWTTLFTQSHKGERGSRLQNGDKWTCAGRCCCDVWLFNETMSTHFRKKEIRGKKRRSTRSTLGTVRDLLVETGNLWWVTKSESTTLNESWPSPTCSPVNPVDLLPLKGTVYTVHFGWFNRVDQPGGPV